MKMLFKHWRKGSYLALFFSYLYFKTKDCSFLERTPPTLVYKPFCSKSLKAKENFPLPTQGGNFYLGKKKSLVIEKEWLGIIWATEKFRKYFFGALFVLETDHKPLSFMHSAKVLNPRIMRWALKPQSYRFRIVATRGQDNLGADYLSRWSIPNLVARVYNSVVSF